MPRKKPAGAGISGRSPSIDRDDAPELTDAYFERADVYEGDRLVRPGRGPGRPKSAAAKVAVSLRLDPEVLQFFRSTGPGWQSRMNAVLRRAALRKGRTPTPTPAAPRGRRRSSG